MQRVQQDMRVDVVVKYNVRCSKIPSWSTDNRLSILHACQIWKLT
jgi:hypothetical protein